MKILMILMIIVANLHAQSGILNDYIGYALEHNLALKQKQFSLEKSITELDQAKGMFFPSIGINARYTRAGGGRVIDIPIGDLVNPIYQGLNFLNPAFNYPTNIPNGITRFLREKEHETKLSVIQPIFQPALFYNHSIKGNLVEMQKAERSVYTRSLISQIKIAYYNYLKTLKVVSLFEETSKLVAENLRVTNSLFENDKITIDLVYKAEAELSEIKQKQLEAKNNAELAASYFNFLLNQPLDTKIEIDTVLKAEVEVPSQEILEETALKNREEIQQLRFALEVSRDNRGLAKSGYLPGLSLAADYGFQGEDYKFGKDDDFWMASLVLQWNLFNGFQDESKVEKAEIEIKSMNAKISEIQDMIRLQIEEAYRNYNLAKQTIKVAGDRLKGHKNAFRIIRRKYSEGLASQLEYLDAQNKYVKSEIQKIISEFDLLVSCAELEKFSASIDLKSMFKEKIK